ncbi:MAG: hypothetical protein DBY04_00725 [Clostridiales bacterium]|nr:MAG: hypothetical protein DBY04_00725 [Clostridiales bacterium]
MLLFLKEKTRRKDVFQTASESYKRKPPHKQNRPFAPRFSEAVFFPLQGFMAIFRTFCMENRPIIFDY